VALVVGILLTYLLVRIIEMPVPFASVLEDLEEEEEEPLPQPRPKDRRRRRK
jgi:hypothetical protein